eukprot:10570285-Alexandrium_andersonii.AAC.1
MGDKGNWSESEPDGEESPDASDSEHPGSSKEEETPGATGPGLREGEWTKIGDEWVVHHRSWRHS